MFSIGLSLRMIRNVTVAVFVMFPSMAYAVDAAVWENFSTLFWELKHVNSFASYQLFQDSIDSNDLLYLALKDIANEAKDQCAVSKAEWRGISSSHDIDGLDEAGRQEFFACIKNNVNELLGPKRNTYINFSTSKYKKGIKYINDTVVDNKTNCVEFVLEENNVAQQDIINRYGASNLRWVTTSTFDKFLTIDSSKKYFLPIALDSLDATSNGSISFYFGKNGTLSKVIVLWDVYTKKQ